MAKEKNAKVVGGTKRKVLTAICNCRRSRSMA